MENIQRYKNRTGNIYAEIITEAKSTNRNKCYYCNIFNTQGELLEQKIIQKCNLIHGSFNISQIKYPDAALRDKLRKDYWNINNRTGKNPSYKNVSNEFIDFENFYYFFIEYFEKYPVLYAPFLKGSLEIEKDAGSYLIYGVSKKVYQPETIHLTSRQENNHIRKVLNSDISNEDKVKQLRKIINLFERE